MYEKLLSDLLQNTLDKIKQKTLKNTYKLTCITLSDDKSGIWYLNNIKKVANANGIECDIFNLKGKSQEEVIKHIEELNKDTSINGIIVNVPVPEQYDQEKILSTVCLEKDIDALSEKANKAGSMPAAPLAVIKIMSVIDKEWTTKKTVVIGEGKLVGKPLIKELKKLNSNFESLNKGSKNKEDICREADIIISAIGQANLLDKKFVSDKSIIIDVGIGKSSDGKICGDFNYDEVAPIVKYISPVPGGVGPLTIAVLLEKLVKIN